MLAALKEFYTVVIALYLRDIKAQYGKRRLGYFWAFIEPTVHILFFAWLKTIVGKLNADGIHITLFLVSGIIPFFLFSHSAKGIVKVIRNNRTLLSFPQVKIMDIVIARALMQLTTNVIVFLVMILGCYLADITFMVRNLPMALFCYSLFSFLGIAFGCLLMVLNSITTVVNYVVNIIFRLLYLTSAIMISVDRIPQQFHYILEYNPIIYLVENFRYYLFDNYQINESFSSLQVPIYTGIIILMLGSYLRKRLYYYLVGDYT